MFCQYDVTEGVSRTQRYKLRKCHRENRTSDLEALVHSLRTGTDLEATTVLARLRLGERVKDIITSFQWGSRCLLFEKNKTKDCAPSPIVHPDYRITPPDSDRFSEHLSYLRAINVDSGIGRPRHQRGVLVPDGALPFLSIIFEREAFRLPITLLEDGENSSKQLAKRKVGFNSSWPVLSSKHELSSWGTLSSGTLRKTNLPLDTDTDRCRRATWVSYPNIENGYAMASSLSIARSGNYPSDAINTQLQTLPIVPWSLMSKNTRSNPGSVQAAFTSVYDEATTSIQSGIPQEQIFGSHPNIAALYNEKEFQRCPMLSQWAASMVHSLKLEGLCLPASLKNSFAR